MKTTAIFCFLTFLVFSCQTKPATQTSTQTQHQAKPKPQSQSTGCVTCPAMRKENNK